MESKIIKSRRRGQMNSKPTVRTSISMDKVLFDGIDHVIEHGGIDGEKFFNRIAFLREITARYLTSIGLPVA